MSGELRPVEFIIHDDDADAVDGTALATLAVRVLDGEGADADALLTVLVGDDEMLRDLNLRFLGIDAPTDVLAFPDAEPLPGEPADLGDIAISLPTAMRQAEAQGRPLGAELAHLLVHGILHLCGYEHERGGEEAARMRAREEAYLGDRTIHGEADATGA